MTFKPEPKNVGDLRNEWFKRKWGMENPATNAALEASRKQILEMLMPRWSDLKDDKSKFCNCLECKEHPRQTQKEYFESILKHQEKWDRIWQEEYNQ